MLRPTLFTLHLTAGLAAALFALAAQPPDVTGVAFVDADGNGVRDAGERGLAQVVVSNQDAVVATDASGTCTPTISARTSSTSGSGRRGETWPKTRR